MNTNVTNEETDVSLSLAAEEDENDDDDDDVIASDGDKNKGVKKGGDDDNSSHVDTDSLEDNSGDAEKNKKNDEAKVSMNKDN